MRVLVCGGRYYKDTNRVRAVLDELHKSIQPQDEITVLIHGAAKGADTLAEEWAILRGIPAIGYSADWSKHGIAAGPIRNKLMLATGYPDLVIAFPGGRGTANMIAQAREAGVEVHVVT